MLTQVQLASSHHHFWECGPSSTTTDFRTFFGTLLSFHQVYSCLPLAYMSQGLQPPAAPSYLIAAWGTNISHIHIPKTLRRRATTTRPHTAAMPVPVRGTQLCTTTSTQARPAAQLHTSAVLQRCRHCIPRAHPSHNSDKPSLDHVLTVQAVRVFVVPPVSFKLHDRGHVMVQLRRTWPACGQVVAVRRKAPSGRWCRPRLHE